MSRYKKMLAVAAMMLTLGLSPVGAQTVTIAVDPGSAESNLYWETVGGLIPPNLQTLIGNDPQSGNYDNSALAESWEHNDDFTVWTFTLKSEAEFSHGWGKVTAEDVVQSVILHTGEDSRLGSIQGLREAKVEAVDEHKVRFTLPAPNPDFLFFHAGRALLTIYSKAQYEAQGLEGLARLPAGSGPFIFENRDLNGNLVFKVAQDHWSGIDINYDRLEFRFVAEPATRLAMLLAGEADIVSLPRELQPDAAAAGHQILTSTQAAQQSTIVMGGLFLDPQGYASQQNLPWVDIRVREAMNRAIDRQAMLDVLYDGRASLLPVWTMDPRFDGYMPQLADRFESAYGYNPERARALLAEAGYPEKFANPVIPIIATSLGGSPEFGLMAELVHSFFTQVGLQAEIREMDWPTLQNVRLSYKADFLHPQRNAPVRPNALGVQMGFTTHLSAAFSLGSEELNKLGADLIGEHDPERRSQILGNMFEFIFDNYAHMPMATVFAEVTVNPKTIEHWIFPGASSTGLSHFELIRAVK